MTRNDKVFGEVEFDVLWQKEAQFTMYDKIFEIKVFIHGDEQEEFSKVQQDAYEHFIENQTALTEQMRNRIFEYYQSVFMEYRSMYEDEADKYAPVVNDSKQLRGFVKPQSIVIPKSEKDRIVNVLFKTKWDLELGIGIQIKNEEIVFVGVQSDVL